MVEKIVTFDYPLDYNGVSDEVVLWAYTKYTQRVNAYKALPWWKRIFQRDPKFVLVREYSDFIEDSPIWILTLKTIDGEYKIFGRLPNQHWQGYFEPYQRFDACSIVKVIRGVGVSWYAIFRRLILVLESAFFCLINE